MQLTNTIISAAVTLAERRFVPDSIVRRGIRKLLQQRLLDTPQTEDGLAAFMAAASHGPIAPVPDMANRQHYELPAAFFELVLGKHRKYSCCLWREDATSLDDAEEAALQATCENADIDNGMRILELGCGWGSLTLWIAEQFPECHVTAVSNSQSQRRHIQQQAAHRELDRNLTVITADMNDFETHAQFDRVVSVEMFEHMRNHALLLQRIAGWLVDDGKLFVHVFCHKDRTYQFHDAGPADWISRYFFTGGTMPGYDLLAHYDRDMEQVQAWQWNGLHYEKTADAWLKKLDAQQHQVLAIFRAVYGAENASLWWQRWRIFFMACAELFGYNDGREWFVLHALFESKRLSRTAEAVTTNQRSDR